jgi:uncharacterized protein
MDFGFTLIKNFEEHNCDFSLYANEDDTEAYLVFEVLEKQSWIKEDLLTSYLDQAGVMYGVDSRSLKKIIKKAEKDEITISENYCVAKGQKAVYGKDAYIDFHVDPSEEDPHFDIEDDKTIDYKNNSLISNVSNEQHLATFHDLKTNQNGIDVFGCEIPTVQPKTLKFKVGSGVRMSKNKIIASTYGRFIFEKEELSVDPVYTVRGNVDLTIGNIDFIGKVIIQKDIDDDFSVSAREGIEVGGIIGCSDIISDKELKVQGGLNGKCKSNVRVEGKLSSKYLNEVNIFGKEDIEVRKSIINCEVKTKGKILCERGSIIGGSTCAYKGMDVAVVGSDLGTVTYIISGVDYELEDRILGYEDKLNAIAKEIRHIERIVEPVLANKISLQSLPVDKRKLIQKVLIDFKNYKDDEEKNLKELEAVRRNSVTGGVKEIYVRDVLYSGTHVTIGKCSKRIKITIKGPVFLKEDLANDTIKITYDGQ